MIIVSKNNDGDFTSLLEAVLSIDDKHIEPAIIYIKSGIYEEKVWIRKNNIKIVGEDKDSTIIRYGDGARKLRPDGTEYGTFNTATILFAGSDITVENLTIENNAGSGRVAGQAIAAYIASNRTAFFNCNFLGYQDTIFTGDIKQSLMRKLMLPESFQKSGINIQFAITRNYFENCFICGDVDYIFGPSVAYFKNCEIFSRKLESENGSFITAASTPSGQEFGYVFYQCKITSDDNKSSVYLGRPWRDYAKTAFVECELGNHIKPEGWHNWDKPKAEVTTSYVEYGNTGEGSNTDGRVPFSKQLANDKIAEYFSIENVLAGEDGWNPTIK